VSFWSLFNWQDELLKVSRNTSAILQVENIIIIFIILYFSLMTFMFLKTRKFNIFARSIVLLIIGFYAIRLIAGYPFFGFSPEELVIWIICVLLIATYAVILFRKRDLETK
jgi:hypothetical protein